MNLEDYRKKIDSIDDDILKLFLQRMEVAGEIAKFKKEQHLAIGHPAREREIIIRLAKAAGPEFASYVQMLYGTLFDVSRAHQHQLNSEPGDLSAKLKMAWDASFNKTLPSMASVACQGTEGAYSGLAAGRCFQLPDITWFRNFEGVAQAVKKGFCDYGILPVENSTYGTVNPVYDLYVTENVCKNDIFTQYNFLFSADTMEIGEHTFVFEGASSSGCDSAFTLTVNILPTSETVFHDTICQYETYQQHNFSLSDEEVAHAGDIDFVQNLQNIYGCDSTVTLHIAIYSKPQVDFLSNPERIMLSDGNPVQFINLTDLSDIYPGETFTWH